MLETMGRPRTMRAVTVVVALPLVIVVALLLFAWPAARIAARDVPLGIVGTGPASQRAVSALQHDAPGAFDLSLYPGEQAAEHAIEDRDIYGALVVTPTSITVLTAGAASPTIAARLAALGQTLGRELGLAPTTVTTRDVVPLSPDDPRGLVLAATVLPIIICAIAIAAAVATLLRLRPGWPRAVALVVGSAASALGGYLLVQGFLGALPHQHLATWAALALIVLATASTVAGFIVRLGRAGLPVGAALMVLVGNPFSGATSAPELLPSAVGHVGGWLPPGAGVSLLRGTAYFGGHGTAAPLAVLSVWAVGGLAAVVLRPPSTRARRAEQ